MSSIKPPTRPGGESPADRASIPVGASCILLVGDKVVLRANAPPEAEYAMFDLEEIDLRSSEPKRVREYGYQTTAAAALARLALVGVTPALARECCAAMIPQLAEAYARGPAARHVARHLGPLEILQSDVYDGTARAYRGVFVDLALMSFDLALPGASATLQALHLATRLDQERGDTTVFLQTDAWTKLGKPGLRTYRRPSLARPEELASALSVLARREPQPNVAEVLPRAEVLAALRARAESAPDQETRAFYTSLERWATVRDMPDKGPLSDPELWALEVKLDASDFDGVVEALDAIERTRGRTPGTTYIRARASLLTRLEPAKLIAERVSALALSMTSFQELSLLAAEAWLEAGEPRRAMPYARDLVEAPQIDGGMLLNAQRLLARAAGAGLDKRKTFSDRTPSGPLPPSAPGQGDSLAPPDPSEPAASSPAVPHEMAMDGVGRMTTNPAFPAPPLEQTSLAPRGARAAGGATSATTPLVSVPPPPGRSVPPSAVTTRADATERAAPVQKVTVPPPTKPSAAPHAMARASIKPEAAISIPPETPRPSGRPAARVPSGGPPPLDLELTPPPEPSASFILELPKPEGGPARTPSVRPRSNSVAPASRVEPRTSRIPPRPATEDRGAASHRDPRAEPESEAQPPREVTSRAELLEGGALRDHARRSQAPARAPDEVDAARGQARPSAAPGPDTSLRYMLGASLPPYKAEEPAPLVPRAPLFPRLDPHVVEAEHLPLPPGVASDVPLDVLPRSILEARVQFTLLSRELGLEYRLKRGVVLKSDVSGIEAMQATLLETFADHRVTTGEDVYELRRHGAFLAEILARSLDAEWIDIEPKELGRWAMIVPPNTRVWPFGRVARLVQMGHKERDLVSYFFELQARRRKT